MGKYAPYYGLASGTRYLFERFNRLQNAKVTVVLFGSPYAADLVENEDALVLAYEEAFEAQTAVSEVLFGGYTPTGRVPVRLKKKRVPRNLNYSLGAGRPIFSTPEDVGMDSQVLLRIDTIANNYIRVGAMPGCAIFVLRGNQVVFHKAYGHHTYENAQPVDAFTSVYDLASVTKVVATTLMAMKLYEQGRLDLEAPLRTFFPELEADPKGDITLEQLLRHEAGFIAHYPFHLKLIAPGGGLDPNFIRPFKDANFSIPIADGLYLHRAYPDSVIARTLRLPAHPEPNYVYSDIDMILLGEVLQRITGQSLEEYLETEFFAPMGMTHTLWNPATQPREDMLVPPTTEEDAFRKRRLQGYVNDDNACLLGGIAGHAGLFANGYDLLKLGMMLKNCGNYADRTYLNPETIDFFTRQVSETNRRGLGWDKPEPRAGYISPTAAAASLRSYGHLGFTGTSFWVDPDNDLVFVMLTNRTFPNADERRQYVQESVRVQVMEVVYRALVAPRRNPAYCQAPAG
jgi:CubicO group peptidase (beta-lactamase class C family)